MSLHVAVRAAPNSNGKPRPEWFSKWVCVLSLLRSLERLPRGTAKLSFFCDGQIPPGVRESMAAHGPVVELGGLGNSRSFRHCLGTVTAREHSGTDHVYLVEDDWLHQPDSLVCLTAALAESDPGDYLTLYDHPDRYTRGDDLRVRGRPVELFGSRHWRVVESTNMSFAASVATIRADRRILTLAASIRSYPLDRQMWHTVQGLGGRTPLRWIRGGRRLLSPIPSLATHCEPHVLAPLVDWELVAVETRAWARDAGLAEEVGW
jgi:hypothetical protein